MVHGTEQLAPRDLTLVEKNSGARTRRKTWKDRTWVWLREAGMLSLYFFHLCLALGSTLPRDCFHDSVVMVNQALRAALPSWSGLSSRCGGLRPPLPPSPLPYSAPQTRPLLTASPSPMRFPLPLPTKRWGRGSWPPSVDWPHPTRRWGRGVLATFSRRVPGALSHSSLLPLGV